MAEEIIKLERTDIESVSLLSLEEYKINRDAIPQSKGWWWIKSSGTYKKNAMYVFFDGEIYTDGYKVDSDRAGVRPVFYLKDEIEKTVQVGEKVFIGKYSATVLDNKSCLIDEIVCNHRFDNMSNNWDTSELKRYIESDDFYNLIF